MLLMKRKRKKKKKKKEERKKLSTGGGGTEPKQTLELPPSVQCEGRQDLTRRTTERLPHADKLPAGTSSCVTAWVPLAKELRGCGVPSQPGTWRDQERWGGGAATRTPAVQHQHQKTLPSNNETPCLFRSFLRSSYPIFSFCSPLLQPPVLPVRADLTKVKSHHPHHG